jgi:hypothetical protein
VLYLRHDAELVLQRTGGEPRVVARFTPRRVRTGGFDLGPAGATWVQQRQRFPLHPDGMPRGPERIGRPQVVLRSL